MTDEQSASIGLPACTHHGMHIPIYLFVHLSVYLFIYLFICSSILPSRSLGRQIDRHTYIYIHTYRQTNRQTERKMKRGGEGVKLEGDKRFTNLCLLTLLQLWATYQRLIFFISKICMFMMFPQSAASVLRLKSYGRIYSH